MKKRLLQMFFLCLPLAVLLTVSAGADGSPVIVEYPDRDYVEAFPGQSGEGWDFQGRSPAVLALNNFQGNAIALYFDVPIYGNMEIHLTNNSVNTVKYVDSHSNGELTIKGNGMLLLKSDDKTSAFTVEGSLKVEEPLRMIGGTSENDRNPLTIQNGKAVTSDGKEATYVAFVPSGSESSIPPFPSDGAVLSQRQEFPDVPSEVSCTVLYQLELDGWNKSEYDLTDEGKITASGNTVRLYDSQNKNYRLAEYTGNEIREISERYDSITPFSESGHALVTKRSESGAITGQGVMDKSGKFVVDIGKYSLSSYSWSGDITDDGYVKVSNYDANGSLNRDAYTLFNLNNGSIIELPKKGEHGESNDYGAYNNGLIPFYEDWAQNVKDMSHSWKYMDSSGNVVFDSQVKNTTYSGGVSGYTPLNAAGDFNHGYAVLHKRVNKKLICSVIDTTGKELFTDTEKKYQDIGDFSAEGLAAAKVADNIYDYIDVHGNVVIPGGYYKAAMFRNGYAVVSKDGKSNGIIDTKGHIVIPFGKYHRLTNVSENGLIWVVRYEYSNNSQTVTHVFLEVLKVGTPPAESPAPPVESNAPAFTDVPREAYYWDPVQWAVDHGVTNGVSATNFAPADTCTRGQVATFLWRAKGCPEPETTDNPFTDVDPSSAFYKAILWAAENGVTAGTSDTTFSPGNPCTRAHVVTFLWRAQGKPEATGAAPLADSFPQGYYTDAVRWADAAGLLDGTGEAFAPSALCPRSDIVTYLYRVLQS